jgi:hypothetical protein
MNKILFVLLSSLLISQNDLDIYSPERILNLSVTENLSGDTYYISDLKGTEIIIEHYLVYGKKVIDVQSNNPKIMNLLESLTEFDDIQTDDAKLREIIWRLDEFNSGNYFRYTPEDYGQVRQDTTLWD